MDFKSIFNSRKHCDLRVIVGKTTFYLHKVRAAPLALPLALPSAAIRHARFGHIGRALRCVGPWRALSA